jgi:penicillin-binding protein 1C
MKLRPIFIAIPLALMLTAGPVVASPGFEEVKKAHRSSEAILLDRHGEPLHELRVDLSGRRLAWVKLEDISPVLIKALVQAEDRRFFEHEGVDWRALVGAAVEKAWGRGRRGGSTLTMQLAAHLEPSLKPQGSRRTLAQKIDQISLARQLERYWSKNQILEAYLNLVTFRGELIGVGAAARGIFGKAPGGLDEEEAALLVTLLRSPKAAPEAVARRASALTRVLKINTEEKDIRQRVAEALGNPTPFLAEGGFAPHVARQLLKRGGEKIISTIDLALQRFALEALQRHLALLAGRNVRDGAVVAADNITGEILAYVGNSGSEASASHVDGAVAPRQAGSTLKPFLYGLAFEKRLLTAASLLDDSPVNLVTPSGLYVPQNYDRDFKGLVSARGALGSSLNVPAVRALMLVSADRFVDRLQDLGFTDITEGADYYGFALALGSAEVRLTQLVNAYRTLANNGRWSPLLLRPDTPRDNERRIMDAAAGGIISDILADPEARGMTFGLSSPLASRGWAAVKTGTSKDMRDNWCVGYSRRYTVGVWVGNFNGDSMWDVSGVSGAAPIWLEVMNFLHPSSPGRAPMRPVGLESVRVRFDADLEPERAEIFLAGTASPMIKLKGREAERPRIVYPARGVIIALDPDIPAERQRVHIQVAGLGDPLTIRLAGEELTVSPEGALWQPRPGRHAMSLVDASGAELDRTEFEVRGNLSPRR